MPMVQDLLNTLRKTQEPQTGLRNQLANKLEDSFQNIHTPPALTSGDLSTDITDDMGWSIFDEMSLQFPYPAQWPIQEPLQ